MRIYKSGFVFGIIVPLIVLVSCGKPEVIQPTSPINSTTLVVNTSVFPATGETPSIVPVTTITPGPAVSPTPFSPIRRTPITLMLHESTQSFDSVKYLKDFVKILKENDFRVITYQVISKDPDITAREQGKLAIISIDDLTLSKFNPSVKEMISILLEANYPAVLGVVTQGQADPTVVEYLKFLSDKGWEIASHTDTHPNLDVLEKTSQEAVYLEVKASLDKLEAAIGVRPITLVLPYGQIVYDNTPIQKAGIVWIVGIISGDTFDMSRPPYYVGREGPNGTAERAFKIMTRRFNP